MPYIQCEVNAGLTAEQKNLLSTEIARAVNEELGSPIPYIHVAVREVPGKQFVEAGVVDMKYGDGQSR